MQPVLVAVVNRDLAGSSSVFLTLGCSKSFGSIHSASAVFVNVQSCCCSVCFQVLFDLIIIMCTFMALA